MKPRTSFNTAFKTLKAEPSSAGSWWASPQLTREQFAAQVEKEKDRMRNSRGSELVSSIQGQIAKERSQ